jgi:hypothetical protein
MLYSRPDLIAWLCPLLLVLGIGSQPVGSAQTLTEERATALFKSAADVLGVKVEAGKLAVSKAAATTSIFGAPIGYAVKVEAKGLKVELDTRIGKVVSAFCEAFWDEQETRQAALEERGRQFAPTRDVRAVLESVLKQIKGLGQEMTPDIRLRSVTFDPSRGNWQLHWLRYYQGFPFEEQFVSVLVDDSTLRCVMYQNTITAITCPTDVKISTEKATEVAAKQAMTALPEAGGKAEDYKTQQEGGSFLGIVYSKGSVKTDPAGEDALPRARLAYAVRFVFLYSGKAPTHVKLPRITVYIDAETGEQVART